MQVHVLACTYQGLLYHLSYGFKFSHKFVDKRNSYLSIFLPLLLSKWSHSLWVKPQRKFPAMCCLSETSIIQIELTLVNEIHKQLL